MSEKSFIEKYNRFSEILWLVVGLLALVTAIIFIAFLNRKEDGMFALILTGLASAMYSIRRVYRRKVDRLYREQKEREQREKEQQ